MLACVAVPVTIVLLVRLLRDLQPVDRAPVLLRVGILWVGSTGLWFARGLPGWTLPYVFIALSGSWLLVSRGRPAALLDPDWFTEAPDHMTHRPAGLARRQITFVILYLALGVPVFIWA